MKWSIIFAFIVVISILIPLVQADYIYKQYSATDIKYSCFNNGTFCTNAATCNLTSFYPNSTIFIDNQAMTYNPSYFNYTLPSTEILGNYQSSIACEDSGNNTYSTFDFSITSSGNQTTTSDSILFAILIIACLVISVICVFIGISIGKPIVTIVGILMGIIFMIFAFQLIILTPNVQGETELLNHVSMGYQMLLWIFYLFVTFAFIFMLSSFIQWQNYNKKSKMRKWDLLTEEGD